MTALYYNIDSMKSVGASINMKQDIEKVLISEDEIQQKVKQLGEQLTSEYSDTFPLAIGVLKGALPLWLIL